jgi:hypothetical protein
MDHAVILGPGPLQVQQPPRLVEQLRRSSRALLALPVPGGLVVVAVMAAVSSSAACGQIKV